MTCLPRGLQQLSSLRSLTIVRCGTLESLPDWLENLPYLRLVRLSACPMLHSVPESLRLRHFTRICIEDCPNLKAQSSGKQKKSCIVRINLMAHF
jgi:structure-specific endonuclease subunit SLX1